MTRPQKDPADPGPPRRSILVLATRFPDPAEGDAGWRLLQLLRHLRALGLEVDLDVFRRDDTPPLAAGARAAAARRLARSVEVSIAPSSGVAGTLYGLCELARRFLGLGLPTPTAWRRRLRTLRRGVGYRAALITDPALVRFARSLPAVLKLVDVVDLGVFHPAFGHGGFHSGELLSDAGQRRFRRDLRSIDRALLPSLPDAQIWRGLGFACPATVLPYSSFRHGGGRSVVARAPASRPTILQIAANTLDDLATVRFLRKRVLSRVRQRVPTARLRVLGAAGASLADGRDVELIGSFDGLEEIFATSHVVVFPALSGKRVRPFLIEALARGKAVVATRTAVHGVEMSCGRDAIVVDEASDLVEPIVQVLTDEHLRERLERRARAHARSAEATDPLETLRWVLRLPRPAETGGELPRTREVDPDRLAPSRGTAWPIERTGPAREV